MKTLTIHVWFLDEKLIGLSEKIEKYLFIICYGLFLRALPQFIVVLACMCFAPKCVMTYNHLNSLLSRKRTWVERVGNRTLSCILCKWDTEFWKFSLSLSFYVFLVFFLSTFIFLLLLFLLLLFIDPLLLSLVCIFPSFRRCPSLSQTGSTGTRVEVQTSASPATYSVRGLLQIFRSLTRICERWRSSRGEGGKKEEKNSQAEGIIPYSSHIRLVVYIGLYNQSSSVCPVLFRTLALLLCLSLSPVPIYENFWLRESLVPSPCHRPYVASAKRRNETAVSVANGSARRCSVTIFCRLILLSEIVVGFNNFRLMLKAWHL